MSDKSGCQVDIDKQSKLLRTVEHFRSQLDDSVIQFTKITELDHNISDDRLMDEVSTILWQFWDRKLLDIEVENAEVLNTIQLTCGSSELMDKFTDALAKFRVMGKLYSSQIAEDFKNAQAKRSLETCQLSIMIALEDMTNHLALKHTLCKLAAQVDAATQAATKKTNGNGREERHSDINQTRSAIAVRHHTLTPSKASEAILAGVHWRLMYEKSPKFYAEQIKRVLKDDKQLGNVLQGEKYLNQMPTVVSERLLSSARALINSSKHSNPMENAESFQKSYCNSFDVTFL